MGNKLQHGHLDADDGGTLTAAAIPALAANGKVLGNSGTITTTSTSLVDLTGASITFTTTARPVFLSFSGSGGNTTNPQTDFMNFDVDGTAQLGTSGTQFFAIASGAPPASHNIAHLADSLTAGSHTFKVRWCVDGGTGTIYATTASPYSFSAIEIR